PRRGRRRAWWGAWRWVRRRHAWRRVWRRHAWRRFWWRHARDRRWRALFRRERRCAFLRRAFCRPALRACGVSSPVLPPPLPPSPFRVHRRAISVRRLRLLRLRAPGVDGLRPAMGQCLQLRIRLLLSDAGTVAAAEAGG